jgi:hypothetical protein
MMARGMDAPIDYFDLAHEVSREDFVKRCPFPFFVGADVLRRPQGPARTIVQLKGMQFPDEATPISERPVTPTKPLVLPVRKVQPVFPSMISLGRTNNNDIVVPDVQVSKVHAFLRPMPDGTLEISDAGSRNGTWVSNVRLTPKGAAHKLLSGERVRFGTLEFVFFNSEVCWGRLRAWRR